MGSKSSPAKSYILITLAVSAPVEKSLVKTALTPRAWHTGRMTKVTQKHYLVGGAVRDQLLGIPVKDRDWVVVGATPEEMRQRGYQQVGADFPVFLHPQTGDEYALARTERKTGQGYQGFVCDFAPNVTLEEDLERRDLTINAMAMDDQGNVIDPFGGQQDLQRKQLRHVSPAFSEDPLRVIRVARFAARFANQGFVVAPETMALMRDMSASGELNTLTPQRVWQDLGKALLTDSPSTFFLTLRSVGALSVVLPEIDALFGKRTPIAGQQVVDSGMQVMQALDRTVVLTDRLDVRFAALCHDIGNASIPTDRPPGEGGQLQRKPHSIQALCSRLHVSKRLERLATLTADYQQDCHQLLDLEPARVLAILESFRALQDDHALRGFALACQACAPMQDNVNDLPYPQAEGLLAARDAAAAVSTRPLLDAGLTGPALGEALSKERTKAIAQALEDWKTQSL